MSPLGSWSVILIALELTTESVDKDLILKRCYVNSGEPIPSLKVLEDYKVVSEMRGTPGQDFLSSENLSHPRPGP